MEPIVCENCGNPISNKYEVYMKLRQDLMATDTSSSLPEMRMRDPTPQPKLEEIFKILRLPKSRYCCRKLIMSIRTIDEM